MMRTAQIGCCRGIAPQHLCSLGSILCAIGLSVLAARRCQAQANQPVLTGQIRQAARSLHRTAPGHESEAETVRKCLTDLNSTDVAVRRRAVMVLGKYQNFMAQGGVIRCLADTDDDVRRSALVSLSEQPSVPPQAQMTIIRLILDPNIHIRRIAASMLQHVLLGMLRSSFSVRTLPPRLSQKTPGEHQEKEISSVLNHALADPDPTVRKSVLSLATSHPDWLHPTAVKQCFSSTDREVRTFAVKAYVTNLKPTTSIEPLLPLSGDPDAIVRREIARALPRFGVEAIQPLRTLADDQEATVRMQAVRGLVSLQDTGALPLLESALRDERIPLDERRSLAPLLLFYEKRATSILRDLAKASRPPLQTEAIRLLGNSRAKSVDLSFFLAFLANRSTNVRYATASVLRRRTRELTEEQICACIDSEFPDVRELGIQLAVHLPEKARADLLLDGCLDDDVKVRCSALRALGRTDAPEQLDILIQSLRDPDTRIQAAAVDGLLTRRTPENLQVLRNYLSQCQDPSLAARIRGRLNPPPRNRRTILRPIPAAVQRSTKPHVSPSPAARRP